MADRLGAWFTTSARRIGKAWVDHAGGSGTIVKADTDEKDEPSDNEDLERELLLFGAKLTPIQRNSVRAFVLLALGQMRWRSLPPRLQGYYLRSGDNGADIGISQVGDVVPEEERPSVAQISEASAEEIRQFVAMRTAELVGMRRQEDGSLIENPDARWAISNTTRTDLVKTVIQAIDEGWTVNQLAAVIAGSYTFSETRAKIIARSELARAQAFGNYVTWHLTGISIFVRWRTSGEENVCPICDGFEAQGVQPLGHEFAPGIEYPTAHPLCNCALEIVPEEDADGA